MTKRLRGSTAWVARWGVCRPIISPMCCPRRGTVRPLVQSFGGDGRVTTKVPAPIITTATINA